jgi:hypothetical protein
LNRYNGTKLFRVPKVVLSNHLTKRLEVVHEISGLASSIVETT